MGRWGGHFAVHLFQAAQNGAVSRKQDQVVPPACQLHHQGFFRQLSKIVIGGKPEEQHPLMLRLAHFQKPGGGEVLAQQHAEHGGLVRVLPGDLGEMGPGVAGAGGEEQLHIACGGPQGQDHGQKDEPQQHSVRPAHRKAPAMA